jgi:predicted ArsR family transcriptional regulator
MEHIRHIPMEIRWRIAARTLTFMPLAFARAFRETKGRSYEAVRSVAYREIAREITTLLSSFHFPATNAAEVAHAGDIIATIVFSPGMEGEPVEISHERVVFRIRECPVYGVSRETGIAPEMARKECEAFYAAMIEELNPAYSVAFSGGICTGSEFCDMTVARKEPPVWSAVRDAHAGFREETVKGE